MKVECEFATTPRSPDCFSVPLGDGYSVEGLVRALMFDVERCDYALTDDQANAMGINKCVAYYQECDAAISTAAQAFLATNPIPEGAAAEGVSFYIYLSDYYAA